MQRLVVREGADSIPEENKAKIMSCLDTMESFLDGQDWFSATENVSIADLSILASLSTLVHAGLDLSYHPNLTAWYERCKELPGSEENEEGANMFGSFLKSKLAEGF